MIGRISENDLPNKDAQFGVCLSFVKRRSEGAKFVN